MIAGRRSLSQYATIAINDLVESNEEEPANDAPKREWVEKTFGKCRSHQIDGQWEQPVVHQVVFIVPDIEFLGCKKSQPRLCGETNFFESRFSRKGDGVGLGSDLYGRV